MAFVRRYKNMNTDLDKLYGAILKELQDAKELNISNELGGQVNGVPFRSVTATRVSLPRTVVGALREVTVTISGTPADYIIEMHTGAWFSNMIVPGTGGLLVAGPIGGVAAAGTSTLLSVEYQRKLKNRIKELVKQHSKEKYTEEKIETFLA